MKMKNNLIPEDIAFKFMGSFAFTTHHHSKFVCDEFGIEMEKVTRVKAHGDFAEPKTYYYITGQEKEYTSLDELCKDWNEIKNFDDPNSEIKWVKVIKSKIDSHTLIKE